MSHIKRPELLTRSEMDSIQATVAELATFEDRSVPTIDQDTSDGRTLVAGVDQAFTDDVAISAIVVLDGTDVIERVSATVPIETPYVPGYLAFREGPSILAAIERLSIDPDLFLIDGNGRIHYRQAGLATHVGVVVGKPTIGIAKRLLCGRPIGPIDSLRTGERVELVADDTINAPSGTTVGYVVQTRQYESDSRSINPIYVSPGHRVCAETAVDITLKTCGGYKLPEPIRLADKYADTVKRDLV